MYVKDTLQYKPRPDLEVLIEGEFETIFIETTNTNKNTNQYLFSELQYTIILNNKYVHITSTNDI